MTLLVSYFLVSWTPTVLTLNGASPQRAALASTLLNVGGVVGAWVVSSIARGRALLHCIAGYLCVGALLIATLGRGGLGTSLLSLLLLFAVGTLIIGAQLNFPALSVYFYPPSVSATGVGLSMAIGRVGSILGPLIGGYLAAAHVGWDTLFLIASIPALVAGLATALMGKSRAQGAS
jgi:AAHS family 4-hydroxybenzoate transporter-like MFS transporter